MPKYTLVDADNWVGLYRDGKLLSQGHRFRIKDVFDILDIELKIAYPDSEWMYQRGDLPDELDEVEL